MYPWRRSALRLFLALLIAGALALAAAPATAPAAEQSFGIRLEIRHSVRAEPTQLPASSDSARESVTLVTDGDTGWTVLTLPPEADPLLSVAPQDPGNEHGPRTALSYVTILVR